jgi:hypothetical protein
MTNIALNQARLTDALERNILEASMNQQSAVHPFAAIKRAVGAFFNFIDEVQETMNQARATSNRFSGSQW